MQSRAPVANRRRRVPVRRAVVRRVRDFIVKLLIVRVSCTPHYTFRSLSRPNFGGGGHQKFLRAHSSAESSSFRGNSPLQE